MHGTGNVAHIGYELTMNYCEKEGYYTEENFPQINIAHGRRCILKIKHTAVSDGHRVCEFQKSDCMQKRASWF